MLAVIYAIVAGVEIWKTTRSAEYNREIIPEANTAPMEGAGVVEYAFTARHEELKGLWVFFKVPPGAAPEGRLDLSMRREDGGPLFWSQSFTCKSAELVGTAYLCRIEGLTLQKGTSYVLTYAMPEMKPGTGWRLSYYTMEKAVSTLSWDGKVRRASQPSMLWLERTPRYPIRNLLAGVFLLALCSIAARETTRFYLPAMLIAAVGCILSATYYWQIHLWQFWGNFWPDGYVGLGYQFYEVLTGRISPGECLAFLRHDRTGQTFFLPLIMGVFQVLGLSVKGAFLAANALFLTIGAGVLVSLLRLYGVTSDRSTLAAVLVFFSHHCVISAVSEFQSDLAGTAMAMCCIYTLLRALAVEDPELRRRRYLVCGVVGFLAAATRLALLPMPLIPVCLFLWSLVCERQRPLRERWGYTLPAAVAVTLLCATWSLFGLWGTLQLNWAFASTFQSLFSWKQFFILALQGLEWSLLVVLVFWRRLFSDRAFVVVVGSAAGLLAMLIYSQQPSWLRYYDPIAAIGVMMLVWPLKEWPKWQCAFLAVAWVSVFVNAFLPA
ncbi:MAG TPA: hypothetical protein VK961_14650 [Chthoniobacter sp.]|nr:hypothetical protein [Chthoniobacter sp.]